MVMVMVVAIVMLLLLLLLVRSTMVTPLKWDIDSVVLATSPRK